MQEVQYIIILCITPHEYDVLYAVIRFIVYIKCQQTPVALLT